MEIDLEAMRGEGDYAQTLDVTDVCTAWTETQAVKNKVRYKLG